MKQFAFVFAALIIASPAMAKDLLPSSENMELYPKSRAKYQSRFDEREEAYEINKRAYIDNMYEHRGEGGTSASTEPMLPESDLDAYLNSAEKAKGSTQNPPNKAPPLPSNK